MPPKNIASNTNTTLDLSPAPTTEFGWPQCGQARATSLISLPQFLQYIFIPIDLINL
jgi:hypothetical protein